ncbi:hypothetical protein BDQ17DRAFT_1363326 [Cyathus striatus]|nr:hypothetical protein BDQ17DRAFT_1363326 [Cyathus striatus]
MSFFPPSSSTRSPKGRHSQVIPFPHQLPTSIYQHNYRYMAYSVRVNSHPMREESLIVVILKAIGFHYIFVAIMTAIGALSCFLGGTILHFSSPSTIALIGGFGASMLSSVVSAIGVGLAYLRGGSSRFSPSNLGKIWARFTMIQKAVYVLVEVMTFVLFVPLSATLGYCVLLVCGSLMNGMDVADVWYMGALGSWTLLGVAALLMWPVGLCYALTDDELLRTCFGLG